MRFTSAITTNKNWSEAVTELSAQVLEELGAEKRDLAVLFVHPHYASDLKELLAETRTQIGARHIIGCTAAAIVGENREIEQAPALSLLVGRLPNVDIAPFHLTQQILPFLSRAMKRRAMLQRSSQKDSRRTSTKSCR